MGNRAIEMYEYRQIIFRMRQGESDRAIARAGLVGRRKAKEIRGIAEANNWLDINQALPEDETLARFFQRQLTLSSTESKVTPYKEEVTKWCLSGVKATAIYATLVRKYNFQGSYNGVQRFVQKIKNDVPTTATVMLCFKPGEVAQVDFGKGPVITDSETGKEISTWFFVMTLAWSRHQYAELVTNQKVETWLSCHRRAFEFFNGVPSKLQIDNAKCAITKACYYEPEVQRAYGKCAEAYGFIISPCPPRDAKKKGRVEAGVKYLKMNFMPLRDFHSLEDANSQLKQWVLETAGNRIHGTTHEKPLTRFMEVEKLFLSKLPDVPPELASWKKVILHRDCHIRFEKCYYSAPYTLIGKELWLRAGETSIRIYLDQKLVVIHSRLFKPGLRSTINEHLPPNARAYELQNQHWCINQAESIGINCKKITEHLFSDKILDNLRAAQGLIKLSKTYGKLRLEAACKRALVFASPRYNTVKMILKKGLEYDRLPDETAFDYLSQVYTGGGKFCRDTSNFFH